MKVLFAESHNLDRPDRLGSHHYIQLFREAGWQCLWLGPSISPLHLFKPDRLNRQRFRVWREGVRQVNGINWIVPFAPLIYYNLPLLRSLYIGRRQYHFGRKSLLQKLAKAGFGSVDLLWCAGPAALSLLDIIPHRLSIYRLADRLDQFKKIPSNVVELQKELIQRADIVVATSHALLEWAGQYRREVIHYLPNGVNDHFLKPAGPLPEDFPSTELPVAVYAGTLDTRFDIKLFTAAVHKIKQVYFLLIGPLTDQRLKSNLKALQGDKNFSWLGAKEHQLIPSYLKYCSVGLIPFKLNKLTEAVNPIKYYEYLACGLPVVAPPMRELVAMEGPVHLYKDYSDFQAALKDAVSQHENSRKALVNYAAEHTWRKRFDMLSGIIKNTMFEKTKPAGEGRGSDHQS